jgi:putative ABC transport system permease protein
MEAAGLLGFGSLARYEVFLRLPERDDRTAIGDRYRTVLEATQVRYTLAEEQARQLSNGVRFLGRFLALVGLAALLLGGIGVASAIHVYIRERRPGVAVLRCIGAGQWSIFLAYLIQASALGFLGSLGGVVLGSGLQRVLPLLLGGTLPVEVTTRFSVTSAAAGLGIGIWVAAMFALIPLLQVRDIPPLQALRRDFEPGRRRADPVRGAAYAALVASIVVLCVLEAPEPLMGVGFALGLGVCLALLGAVAWTLSRLTRRFFPSRASYPVRQGVSNLFRPQNQTVSVTLALGFGAFIVGTVLEVERNVMDDLSLSFGQDRPNVLLFDVQPDQVEGISDLLPDDVRSSVTVAPIVPSRLESINGRPVEELRADSTAEDRPERWAVRREYRNTYRSDLGPAERLVAGRWWDGTPGAEDPTEVDAGDLPRVSLEVEVARDLGVGLGDTLAWNMGGTSIPSVITSLRAVEWDRLEPNFFAIFEPGPLDFAPQTIIMVARIGDPERRAGFQRSLVAAFPNVSALDFSRVQEAVDTILSRVRQAIAFLGAFSVLAGVVVLVGALATSRLQRMREGALLKTLGARKAQVLGVLFAEYLALGTMATSSGLLLAWAASALMVPRLFEVPYAPHLAPMGGIWLAVAGVTVTVGLASSRRLLRRPPLEVLRDIAD